jgi:KipI family sensor histidine kinase inhibitor
MVGYRILTAGDAAVVVEFGDSIDRRVNAMVLALDEQLRIQNHEGILETVPTFRSLMIYYDSVAIAQTALAQYIATCVGQMQVTERPSRTWQLPVCYDSDVAPDLSVVAERTGLSARQVIERHSAPVYHVYMLGFLPGLAYMGNVPSELMVPRLETPRPRIASGSLGIAMSMSSIIPRETASGHHLIGRSPVAMWRARDGALLKPGDKVMYRPISIREYHDLAARVADGSFKIAPLIDQEDIAA